MSVRKRRYDRNLKREGFKDCGPFGPKFMFGSGTSKCTLKSPQETLGKPSRRNLYIKSVILKLLKRERKKTINEIFLGFRIFQQQISKLKTNESRVA